MLQCQKGGPAQQLSASHTQDAVAGLHMADPLHGNHRAFAAAVTDQEVAAIPKNPPGHMVSAQHTQHDRQLLFTGGTYEDFRGAADPEGRMPAHGLHEPASGQFCFKDIF